MLKPTGHRVLIRPDEQPSHSDLILLPEHREYISTSGTVVALGPGGSKVRFDARQRALRDALDALVLCERGPYGTTYPKDQVTKLLHTPDPVRDIAVGDRVAFDSESGLRVTEDGIEYLIMNEDDVVVIVEESEAVA